MKVFITGATGYTGRVVAERLIAAGHEVQALARPHHNGTATAWSGPRWIWAGFDDAALLTQVARDVDAVVHIGASHDREQQRLDAVAINAFAAGLAGSGKTFISTSATPVYGDTGRTPRDEREPIDNPAPSRRWRIDHDRLVVDLAARAVRGVVIRPAYIYGRAGGWLAAQILRARETGQARYIGEGLNLTSTVHVEALAELYLLALENPEASGIYNAASDDLVRSRDAAELIARLYGDGIVAQHWPLDEARQQLGDLAELSCVESVIDSTRARAQLGWRPQALGLTTELAAGSYRHQALSRPGYDR